MSRFSILAIVMIFIIIAFFTTMAVWTLSNWAAQDMCRNTEQYKLIDSGDYYSCLKEMK